MAGATEHGHHRVDRRLQEAIDAVPVLIAAVGADLHYEYNNEAYRTWFGVEPEALRGTPVAGFLGADVAASIRPYVDAALRGVDVAFELELPHQDGSARIGRVSFTPRVDGQQCEGFYVSIVDVTRQKLSEQALVQASREVEEAARHKDDFLAMLGHELRNPLAPIANVAEIVARSGAGDPRLERAAEILRRQVRHLGAIVDDLLDVTRISRGKIRLRRRRIDAGQVVDEVVELHRMRAVHDGISLSARKPDEPIWLEADPVRILQVLDNLVGNAISFTNRGGRVLVELRVAAGAALLCVRDTGIGMDRDMLARAFEPFRQAEEGIERTRGGLGLGLPLVRGLVELHGGQVTADSDGPGTGSTITVRLPLAVCADPLPVPDASNGNSRLRVLVIEDNVDTADTLREVLEMVGHTVDVAHDGETGLRVARSAQPDVVVCDLGLPGTMKGYDVARTMRADPELDHTRLIALTGYGQPEDRRRSRDAGFDVHLTKPVDLADLERACVPASTAVS